MHQLYNALLLGLISGLTPGQVITWIFANILRYGVKKSWIFIFIAFISECLLATSAYLMLNHLQISNKEVGFISIIGGFVLLYMARKMWKINYTSFTQKNTLVNYPLNIFFIVFFNGIMWLFWITVCAPKAIQLEHILNYGDIFFIATFQAGWLFACFILISIFSVFRPLLVNPNILPIIYKVFAFMFVYFALHLFISSFIYI